MCKHRQILKANVDMNQRELVSACKAASRYRRDIPSKVLSEVKTRKSTVVENKRILQDHINRCPECNTK